MTPTDVEVVCWDGCYDEGWRDLIVPAAFAHPAKMARGLVARIFDELFARGALQRGSTVCDPFGGIGTTAIEGAPRGVQVVCCELESKFVGLAQENIALHRRDWQAMGRPIPRVVQGDSRKLRQHVGPVLAECVVSSPPYSPDGLSHGGGSVDAVISSPPYAEIASGSGGLNTKPAKDGQQGGRSALSPSQDTDSRYGTTDGQLARMALGDVDAVVASPPFLDARSETTASVKGHTPTDHDPEAMGTSRGNLQTMRGGAGVDAIVCSPPYAAGDSASAQSMVGRSDKSAEWVKKNCGSAATQGYGASDGQLGVMALGDVDAVVASPPWGADATGGFAGTKWKNPEDALKAGRGNGCSDEARLRQLKRDQEKTYGESDGQLATMPMTPSADALVSSPPYSGEAVRPSGIDAEKFAPGVKRGGANSQAYNSGYGETDGQLGGLRNDETFWSAALDIVRESFAILKPGGTAVWVVKHFVRDKHLVDFPGDWRKLCEHVGFVTETEVHAMLVHEETRSHLFDGEVVKRRERKSFFRRLAEKKGSPRIDFETVYFMRKP